MALEIKVRFVIVLMSPSLGAQISYTPPNYKALNTNRKTPTPHKIEWIPKQK
jgi:hypothetical protein